MCVTDGWIYVCTYGEEDEGVYVYVERGCCVLAQNLLLPVKYNAYRYRLMTLSYNTTAAVKGKMQRHVHYCQPDELEVGCKENQVASLGQGNSFIITSQVARPSEEHGEQFN